MLGTQDVWMFVLAGVTLNLTPGPDNFYILGRSLAQGKEAGIVSALGIGTGTLVHTTAAAFGLSALLASSATAFKIVQWMGAAYLVFLGIQMFRSGGRAAVAQLAQPAPASLTAIYRQAVLTNVLNPKVALFFIAFLPQFIDPAARHRPWPFLFLGSLFICTGTIWCIALALVAARASKAMRAQPQRLGWIRRATGLLFVGLGIRLATQRAH